MGMPTTELSPRQLEVVQAIADTGSAKIAARNIGIARNTVFDNLKVAGEKLKANGMVQIVVAAMRKGLIH